MAKTTHILTASISQWSFEKRVLKLCTKTLLQSVAGYLKQSVFNLLECRWILL
jgi:hypothetical protein